jgi:hypothetical protein
MSKESLNSEESAVKSIIVDFIFTFLPILVIFLIQLLTLSCENIFAKSDWSYISMILYGQTIIKFFSGFSENLNKKKTYEAVLYVSLVIAFGLVPSIIILVLMETNHKEVILFVFQMIWLVISIAVYLILGTVGNILASQKLIKNSDFTENSHEKN